MIFATTVIFNILTSVSLLQLRAGLELEEQLSQRGAALLRGGRVAASAETAPSCPSAFQTITLYQTRWRRQLQRGHGLIVVNSVNTL